MAHIKIVVVGPKKFRIVEQSHIRTEFGEVLGTGPYAYGVWGAPNGVELRSAGCPENRLDEGFVLYVQGNAPDCNQQIAVYFRTWEDFFRATTAINMYNQAHKDI